MPKNRRRTTLKVDPITNIPLKDKDQFYPEDYIQDMDYLDGKLGDVLEDLLQEIPCIFQGTSSIVSAGGNKINIPEVKGFVKDSKGIVRPVYILPLNNYAPNFFDGDGTYYVKYKYIEEDYGAQRNKVFISDSYYWETIDSSQLVVDKVLPTGLQDVICLGSILVVGGNISSIGVTGRSKYATFNFANIAPAEKSIIESWLSQEVQDKLNAGGGGGGVRVFKFRNLFTHAYMLDDRRGVFLRNITPDVSAFFCDDNGNPLSIFDIERSATTFSRKAVYRMTGSDNAVGLKTSLSELNTDKIPFVWPSDINSVKHKWTRLRCHTVGSGYNNLRVIMHNSSDVELFNVLVPIGNLSAGAWFNVYFESNIFVAGGSYHIHVFVADGSYVSQPFLYTDVVDDLSAGYFQVYYKPTAGRYSTSSNIHVPDFYFYNNVKVVNSRTGDSDNIIGGLPPDERTNSSFVDIMPVDFSNDTVWNNWDYYGYIGVDCVTGRFKLPSGIITNQRSSLLVRFNFKAPLDKINDKFNLDNEDTQLSFRDRFDRILDIESVDILIGRSDYRYKRTALNYTNIAIGTSALNSLVSGTLNVAIGASSMVSAISNNYNVAIGYRTLNKLVSGDGNIAIGANTLSNLSTGNYNIAIGSNALANRNSNNNNIAIGYSALTSALATNLIGIGTDTLFSTTSGNNIAIGNRALRALTTGFNNIAIGFSAIEANITGANNIAIGNNLYNLATNVSNTVLVGNKIASVQTGNYSFIGIGTSIFNSNNVSSLLNSIFIGNSIGLSATYTGCSSNIIIGNSSLALGGNNNIFIGHNNAASCVASNNVAVGFGNFSTVASCFANYVFGNNILNEVNSATYNCVFGGASFYSISNARYNIAIGFSNCSNISTCDYNVFIGNNVLDKVNFSSISYSIVIGNNKLVGNSNSYIYCFGFNNFMPNSSVIIGNSNFSYGGGVNSGSTNIVFGTFNFYMVSNAYSNIGIGSEIFYMASNFTAAGNIVIGFSSIYNVYQGADFSSSLVLGNNALKFVGDSFGNPVSVGRAIAIGHGALNSGGDYLSLAIGHSAASKIRANQYIKYNLLAIGNDVLASNYFTSNVNLTNSLLVIGNMTLYSGNSGVFNSVIIGNDTFSNQGAGYSVSNCVVVGNNNSLSATLSSSIIIGNNYRHINDNNARVIIANFDVSSPVTVYGNSIIIGANFTSLNGGNNVIIGTGLVISGSHNIVIGKSVNLSGDGNYIIGGFSVIGTSNQANGNIVISPNFGSYFSLPDSVANNNIIIGGKPSNWWPEQRVFYIGAGNNFNYFYSGSAFIVGNNNSGIVKYSFNFSGTIFDYIPFIIGGNNDGTGIVTIGNNISNSGGVIIGQNITASGSVVIGNLVNSLAGGNVVGGTICIGVKSAFSNETNFSLSNISGVIIGCSSFNINVSSFNVASGVYIGSNSFNDSSFGSQLYPFRPDGIFIGNYIGNFNAYPSTSSYTGAEIVVGNSASYNYRVPSNIAIGNYCLLNLPFSSFLGYSFPGHAGGVYIGDSILAQDSPSLVANNIVVGKRIGYASISSLVDSIIISTAEFCGADPIGVKFSISNSMLFIANQALNYMSMPYSGSVNRCLILSVSSDFFPNTTNFSLTNHISLNGIYPASNRISLGNGAITEIRANVTAITLYSSDLRDKADIEDISIGLDFINKLKVRRFKWDKREWYAEKDEFGNLLRDEYGNIKYKKKDGSKKLNDWVVGFIAQEVMKVEDEYKADFLKIVDRSDPDNLTVTPGNVLMPLIKAVQELTDRVVQLELKLKGV